MSFKAYDEFKDSNIDWIGPIPNYWQTYKLKHVINEFIAGGTPKSSNDAFWDENNNGIPWIAIGDMTDNDYVNSTAKSITREGLADKNLRILKKGTLIYSIFASLGKSSILNIDATTNQAILGLITSNKIDVKYLKYYLEALKSTISRFSNENTQENLNSNIVKNMEIAIPQSLEEQKQIATYLDNQTTNIDANIKKNKELIDLLEEKRVALINQVVTKGLNPDVPMKDSDVEWIGEIPKHWDLAKFRNVLKERSEKNNPIKSKERLSLSIDKGVTLYAEKTTNLDRFKDDFTQYKLAHKGDLVLNSMNMIVGAVGVSKYFGCVSPVYYTYYDETGDNTITKYCDYLFKTKTIKKYLRSLGRGIMSIDRGDDRINTCRLKVSRDDLRNMHIPFPPLNEQKEINNYLDEECEKITNVTSVINKHIELLEEYKSSLIHHVVTGKIDVREEVI